MLAVKRSTKRRLACAPRAAIIAGTGAAGGIKSMAGSWSESAGMGSLYNSDLMNDKDVIIRYPTIPHRSLWRTKDENDIFRDMAVRACKVTCRDPQGVEHAVEVSAQSLFEAVAQALRVFREYEWSDLALAASVVVRITQPAVEHRVQIRDFYNWLEAAGRSPAEMALKNRLRDIVSK